MYGAILGDMIGAPFEFDRGDKTKDFEMFSDETQFTDDTVMLVSLVRRTEKGFLYGNLIFVGTFILTMMCSTM